MKLTPLDITNKEFKKMLRGYDPEEVDEFLDKIVEDYEELFKENSLLKEKINAMNEKIEHYSKIESTIQNTLLLAQNAAEQAKNSSQKEADLVLKNANETSKKIIDKAHSDVISINDEYDKLKQEFVKFRAKFRNFITIQMNTFEELEKDFIINYNVSDSVKENNNRKIDKNISNDEYSKNLDENLLNEKFFEDEEKESMDIDIENIKKFFPSGA